MRADTGAGGRPGDRCELPAGRVPAAKRCPQCGLALVVGLDRCPRCNAITVTACEGACLGCAARGCAVGD